MKALLRFFIGLLVVVTTACNSAEIEPQLPEDVAASRATTPPNQSETNPTLLTDWENCEYIVMYNPSGSKIEATVPWKSGTSTWLNGDFARDIKREDGWTMLFHTFCSQYRDPRQTYMCFYNKFSGFVKVFYYSFAEDNGKHSVWNIGADDKASPQPLFADNEHFSSTINDEKNYTVWSITVDNETGGDSSITPGWNGFQFHVGEYQPQIAYNPIQIGAYTNTYIDFNFFGVTESQINGTITTLNGTYNKADQNPYKAVINVAGKAAEEAAQSVAQKLPNKNFVGIALSTALSLVKAGSVSGAITSGLGFIFKSLIVPKQTVSEVSLRSEGTVKMDGKGYIDQVSNVEPIVIDFDAILKNRPVSASDNTIATLANELNANVELGVWNLSKKPTIYYDRYAKITNMVEFPEYETDFFDVNGFVDYPNCYIRDVEVVFNPAIKPYIKNYTYQVAMLDVEGGNRELVKIPNARELYVLRQNYICTRDSMLSFYGITDNAQTPISGFVYSMPPGKTVSNDTELYLDWGTNLNGHRAVAIILTWTVESNGKTQTYTDSRLFDVNYKVSTSGLSLGYVNNPPYTYLVNQGSGFSGFYNSINPDGPHEEFIVPTPTPTPTASFTDGIRMPQ
ncbi:MAG: hypothetical protein HDS65_02990 [Bacteroidales bacterium]|nr:hypothetical protein [Bacteroidales bacterium]